MKILINNRRQETFSNWLSIVGDNRPITSEGYEKFMQWVIKD